MNPGPADNIPIWEVARATTAAPTYFDPICIQNRTFGDGGLGLNNPVNDIFWEVANMHGSNGSVIGLVVSIGTGEAGRAHFHWSKWKKASYYLNAMKDLATDSQKQHRIMQNITENNAYPGLNYHRFNLPKHQGLRNMKLDEWQEKGTWRATKRGMKKREKGTLDKIEHLTRIYCERSDVRDEITRVAKILVDHRRARCTDSRKWDLWATGIRYRCTVQNCDKSQKLRPSRQNLIHHIRQAHRFSDETPEEKVRMESLVENGMCHY